MFNKKLSKHSFFTPQEDDKGFLIERTVRMMYEEERWWKSFEKTVEEKKKKYKSGFSFIPFGD